MRIIVRMVQIICAPFYVLREIGVSIRDNDDLNCLFYFIILIVSVYEGYTSARPIHSIGSFLLACFYGTAVYIILWVTYKVFRFIGGFFLTSLPFPFYSLYLKCEGYLKGHPKQIKAEHSKENKKEKRISKENTDKGDIIQYYIDSEKQKEIYRAVWTGDKKGK